ncbi:hypothetical protein ACP6PL_04810 [Dapis sp. BLCC M126]|uniref:hypothetical protein n=1 Tax=Dapis sp. BLCC M126 TaxID=3400189 RepID=UPI003CF39880
MSFNALLNRKGHFWEQRYTCHGFPNSDKQRALNTIRYIHANPKAAGIREGFFYDFSNYGTYEQLTTDGITQWHPAFFELGTSLEECADKYKGFCRRYTPNFKLLFVIALAKLCDSKRNEVERSNINVRDCFITLTLHSQ